MATLLFCCMLPVRVASHAPCERKPFNENAQPALLNNSNKLVWRKGGRRRRWLAHCCMRVARYARRASARLGTLIVLAIRVVGLVLWLRLVFIGFVGRVRFVKHPAGIRAELCGGIRGALWDIGDYITTAPFFTPRSGFHPTATCCKLGVDGLPNIGQVIARHLNPQPTVTDDVDVDSRNAPNVRRVDGYDVRHLEHVGADLFIVGAEPFDTASLIGELLYFVLLQP